MSLLTIILVVLFAIGLGVYLVRREGFTAHGADTDAAADCKSDNKQTEQKNTSKRQILEVLERRQSGEVVEITNDDVEELLDVSDATATRYLSELEDEGKLRQVGTTGKSVYYVKIK